MVCSVIRGGEGFAAGRVAAGGEALPGCCYQVTRSWRGP
ncbi:hypothetical protein FHS38_003389 [Streptomyces netropsis]|uniref:Uncharacterized protein n=1 Tax=Streptomyces netropsis TaxID=55404 RepID=A0A7W7LBX7_STRNE|nr:hypothetical protein [Streptomyces netropsis]